MDSKADVFLGVYCQPPTQDDSTDIIFADSVGLGGDVMVCGCLDHGNHEIVEFKIFGGMRKKGQQICHPGLEESRL